MLMLAHLGVALGSCELGRRIWLQTRKRRAAGAGASADGLDGGAPASRSRPGVVAAVDYRLVMLGAALPDLIDKPAAALLFGSFLGAGRGLSHSLFFVILLSVAGLVEFRKWKTIGLWALSYGVLTHQLLDSMWEQPKTFLWPVFGWSFPKSAAPINLEWLVNILRSGLSNPHVLWPEVIGLAVVIYFGLRLAKEHMVMNFIRYGRLP